MYLRLLNLKFNYRNEFIDHISWSGEVTVSSVVKGNGVSDIQGTNCTRHLGCKAVLRVDGFK